MRSAHLSALLVPTCLSYSEELALASALPLEVLSQSCLFLGAKPAHFLLKIPTTSWQMTQTSGWRHIPIPPHFCTQGPALPTLDRHSLAPYPASSGYLG